MGQAQQQLRFTTVEAFDAWAAGQTDRWELHDGVAVAMAPERTDHARIKARAWRALDDALRARDGQCEALLDGPMVPGPGLRRFQPDVLVTCGERVDGDEQVVQQPILLIEVLSPSTEMVDMSLKLESYFALPSVHHYLIVSSLARRVIHHQRGSGPALATRIHSAGPITLDPPGVTIYVENLYSGTNLDRA